MGVGVHENTIDLDDPLEVASPFAQAAIASMACLGVAPTPGNFLIWYSHASTRHQELSEVLQSLESSGAVFTPSRCAELYERFFGTTRQVRLINDTCEQFEAIMAGLLEEVDGMSANAGVYGGRLKDLSVNLKAVDGKQAVRGMISQILGETTKMLARAQHLEGELNQSSEQMATLKGDLASARREANIDDLTRIANRRCFDYELPKATTQAEAEREPMCLLMADIDHCKAFNDNYGHQVGDQVLRLVARILTSCVKGRDLVARYGGEEFALILPQTGLVGARKLADQICRTVATHRVSVKATGRDLGRVTLSIGCAQHRWGETAAELLRRADRALYQAKRAGRNRVAVASRLSGAVF
jgi:diguanylate cyclase